MAKLTARTKQAGATSDATVLAREVQIDTIQLDPDFESLFPVNVKVLDDVAMKMNKYGFDKSQPLQVWKERNILIDGHTRRLAAIQCDIKTVPVYEHSFSNISQALEYAIGLQTARRNLSDAELATVIIKLDKLHTPGPKNAIDSQTKGKSAKKLASKIGISTRKIERMRTIKKQATPEIQAKVLQGKMTINAAYNATKNTTTVETPYKDLIQNVFKRLADNNQYAVLTMILHDCEFSVKQQKICLNTLSPIQRKKLSEI